MNVCYVNPTFLIRRPIADLINQMADKEDIAIFLPKKLFRKPENKWHSDSSLKKAKLYTYSAINIPFCKFEWPIPITPMFIINLFRIFFRYKVVHLWTYFYLNSFWTVFISIFFPKRKLIMSCDTFPAYSFNPGLITSLLFKIYTFMFGWFLFSVPNKIHIYGDSMVKYAEKAGVKRKNIVIIPTGIHTSKFQSAKPITRSSLNLSKKNFVILYAGLIVPRKGIDLMLSSIKQLSKLYPDIRLLLVGDGPSKKDYIKQTTKLGLSKNIKFIGWRKDIPSIMKASDCLLLPSRGEGLPGIVMEAMASGLPVIASDIPCIPDLIDNGKTGYLCPMNDVKSISARITALIKDKKKAIKMGKAGKKKIELFNWKRLLKDYKELYRTA